MNPAVTGIHSGPDRESRPLSDTSTVPTGLRRFGALVSPYGLVGAVTRVPAADGEADLPTFVARIGDPGPVLDPHRRWSHRPEHGNLDGAGGDLDAARAAHLAVAEAVERYSSCAVDPDRTIRASADELGAEAVDLDSWPRCSPTELADPRCGLVAPDRAAPRRWVRGWSLTADRPVYVPAAHVWLKNPPESAAEAVTNPTSTGCAAHTDPVAAVVAGLLEVVERDAVSLAWLQRLRLPRLAVDPADLDDRSRELVGRGRVPYVHTLLFDATTDLGIPVLFGLQLADHDRHLAQLVAAACVADPRAAVAKVYREAAALRIALRAAAADRTPPAGPDVASVVDGAIALGRRDRRHHFDFLLDGDRPVRRLADLPAPPPGEPITVLHWLLARLRAGGCEVVVVDLTTDEAEQAGAVVVRVLVPRLMPLSFVYRARYLAHPRLYAAPAAMGHPVRAEADVNPVPQPFA
ncbi:YcaO-like family protein [Polymorphospora sp. NPDC050346]|uniref:YcaO-like family protein n=1 Tax=Polymorphospora sp. NPDC050346 TaxID=3155780 RepID=UPI0033FD2294